jgi:putative acetyltransferase
VRALIATHLAFARAESPPEDTHALEPDALADPSVELFACRSPTGELLGVAALARLSEEHAEIKSMHTAAAFRGRGVGLALVEHLVGVARARGYARVSLETGAGPAFAAARRLYARAGFVACEPFASYRPSRHSVYMTRPLG